MTLVEDASVSEGCWQQNIGGGCHFHSFIHCAATTTIVRGTVMCLGLKNQEKKRASCLVSRW